METLKTWVEVTADSVEQFVAQKKTGQSKIICSSGISPSGPIHLGNLREAITVHLVCEELIGRGLNAEHIHSWDDFDRLRKVPSDVPSCFSENIGKPLSDVPDPYGKYSSYAHRFMGQFESALLELGIKPRYIIQSRAYRSGNYTAQIIQAINERFTIFDILSEHQTLDRFEKTIDERRDEYYPIRVYCKECGKDDTVVKSYEASSATIHYFCKNCNLHDSFNLDQQVPCKLVWKVDWPMRWAYEKVDFEPAGEDHAAPGSSYIVGKRIVKDVFNCVAPYFIPYAFVGMSGRSKISSSVGTNATPRAALNILEPPIIRWLYIRKQPSQKFNIDFGQEILRLYDEWDTLTSKITTSEVNDFDKKIYGYCTRTSNKAVTKSQIRVSFRLLSSAADITQGNVDQILRIAADQIHCTDDNKILQTRIEPRLSCAIRWATQYLPEDERTQIREGFSKDTYEGLDDISQKGIKTLVSELDDNWNLERLTQLIYGIPKILLNLPLEADPTNEVKLAQRQFFRAIYSLICNSDTGPRIPTLFLSLGKEKVRNLLLPKE